MTFSDIVASGDDGSQVYCRDGIDAAAETVLRSYRPNPETTIDDA